MIQGVDVHAGYGRIDWSTASEHVRFAYVKCTTGNSPGVDAQFEANVEGCELHGVFVGAYHFAFPLPDDDAHPGRSPEDQVERAWVGCKEHGSRPGELPHAVDAEWPAPQDAAKWGCTPAQISDWLRRYCEAATAKWGRKPIIYTYPAWWRWLAEGADVSWASDYDLWFADYGWTGPGTPPDDWQAPHLSWLRGTWDDWTLCQYSAVGSTVRIPGINACPIDRDCIRDEATLERLAGR